MIESLLKYAFPVEYGLPSGSVNVPICRHNTSFAESDEMACNQCHANRSSRSDCNEEILKVDTNGVEVAVVRFEKYIEQFIGTNANIADRCDLILTESGMAHNKIVFCDLCCYEEKYVEPNKGKYPMGKRAKARQQMERSIDVLLKESTTAVNLLTYPEKVCLFAWRDYDVPDTPVAGVHGNARSNVQVFSSVRSNMASQTTQRMEHGFTFVQVKYPSPYNW